jgi:hypothetical protein
MWRRTVALAAVATVPLIVATPDLRAQQVVPGGAVGGLVPGIPPRDGVAPPKGTAPRADGRPSNCDCPWVSTNVAP